MRKSRLLRHLDIIGIFSIALALRFWCLMEVPMFSDSADIDEVDEWLLSLSLLRSNRILVHNVTGWIGPVFNYCLALLLSLTGIDIRVPRIFMAIVGGLAVIFTYAFASKMYDRRVGLVAGLLLATAPSHILVGRVAWSAGLTPLFTSLGVLFLVEAHQDPRWLPFSFLMLGLAIQSHPVTMIVSAAIALYILFSAKRWLKHRSYLLCAVALFLLGCWNIPYYFLAESSGAMKAIASNPPGGWGYEEYDRLLNQNVINFLKFLTTSKTYSVRKMVMKPHFYILPIVFITGLSFHDYRRGLGDKILLLLGIMFFLAIPLRIHTVRKFPDTYGSHFYLFILPAVYATIANFISRVGCIVSGLNTSRILRLFLSFSILIVVVGYHLWALDDVQANMYREGDTNGPFVEVVRHIQRISGKNGSACVIVDARVPFSLELKRLIEFSTGDALPTYYWEEKGVLSIQVLERRHPASVVVFVTGPESSESTVFLELYEDVDVSEIYTSDGKHIYTLYTRIYF